MPASFAASKALSMRSCSVAASRAWLTKVRASEMIAKMSSNSAGH
jgi:hypothetical protein